jgi:hypothetical protein
MIVPPSALTGAGPPQIEVRNTDSSWHCRETGTAEASFDEGAAFRPPHLPSCRGKKSLSTFSWPIKSGTAEKPCRIQSGNMASRVPPGRQH